MPGRFFDEAAVRSLPDGGELVLGPGDLATPAALDLAFAKKIRVRRGGQSSAPTALPSGSAWSRMLAMDGTYVVEVRGGRPVVHRMTESGPVQVKGD